MLLNLLFLRNEVILADCSNKLGSLFSTTVFLSEVRGDAKSEVSFVSSNSVNLVV